MVLDPMGGIVLTNDGNAILREVKSDGFRSLSDLRSRVPSDSSATPCGQIHDRNQPNARRRSWRWHNECDHLGYVEEMLRRKVNSGLRLI